MEKKKLYKSKTFWTGLVGLITACGAYFTDNMEAPGAIQTGLTSLIGIFLRAGINKA